MSLSIRASLHRMLQTIAQLGKEAELPSTHELMASDGFGSLDSTWLQRWGRPIRPSGRRVFATECLAFGCQRRCHAPPSPGTRNCDHGPNGENALISE
jgi:hypothetical protein